MYLTARPYLLAGFTAASIVAAVPLATKPTVHLPSIHSADVRFAAAESEMASAVGTLRNVEAQVLASVVDRTATTVIPGIVHRYGAATDGSTAPSTQSLASSSSDIAAPNAATGAGVHQPDMARRLTATAQAGTITAADLVPLIGDVAAFNFDLLGTPFAAITALSFAGDLAISDLSSGQLQDIPGDVSNSLQFSIGSTLNLLSADINNLTNAVNALSAIIHPAPPGTQSAADTGAVGTLAVPAAPARTSGGVFDPTAIGPLIGDAAELGLDAVATPFQLAQSLTGALSAAALDLGAGQVQDAQQDFVSSLRVGFVEAQSRLNNDLSSIGAALARLTGTASTPAGQVGAPTSVVARPCVCLPHPAGALETCRQAARRGRPAHHRQTTPAQPVPRAPLRRLPLSTNRQTPPSQPMHQPAKAVAAQPTRNRPDSRRLEPASGQVARTRRSTPLPANRTPLDPSTASTDGLCGQTWNYKGIDGASANGYIRCCAFSSAAARSPITTHGAIVFPVVILGMIEPSATRRPSMP